MCLCVCACVWVSGNVWFIERFMHLMCRALLPVKLDSDETKSNARTESPRENKTATAAKTTTNNHFEMFALKHYKAFQFIQNKWDCFYFSCRLPKNKRNYYWILFCLLIYFCILLFFHLSHTLHSIPLSIYLNITIVADHVAWAYVWFQPNSHPAIQSWILGRVCERAYFVCANNYGPISLEWNAHTNTQSKYTCIYIYWTQTGKHLMCLFFF